MTPTLVIVVVALVGVLFWAAAGRRFSQHRIGDGIVHGTVGTILLLLCVCAVLVMMNLVAYQRLSSEQPAANIEFTRGAEPRLFNALLTYPDGAKTNFELRGDEWQVDARVLKWTAFADLIGFNAAYRLERISGRYAKVQDELTQQRTVYDLNPPRRIDPWEIARQYHSWIPFVDAIYGSATYLPMADGALYEIKVSQSGLLARPLNQAARDAAGNWH